MKNQKAHPTQFTTTLAAILDSFTPVSPGWKNITPETRLAVDTYLRLRGIETDETAFGRQCAKLCRERGIEVEKKRFRPYPVPILEEVAKGLKAALPPMLPTKLCRTFSEFCADQEKEKNHE